MTRKCTYTGKEAVKKDKVLPKNLVSDSEIHNWANSSPVSEEYKNKKLGNMPTELEMQANEFFYMLELARLRVNYYEKKLESVQKLINKKRAERKHQEDLAYHEHQIINNVDINEILENRRKTQDER